MSIARSLLGLLKARRTGLLAVAGALYLIGVGIAPGSMGARIAALILVPLFWAVAALVVLSAGRRSAGTPARWSWSFFGIGLALWAIAGAVRSVTWLASGGPPPLPSVVDLMRMAGYFSLVAGLGAYPVSAPERWGRLRTILDVVILTLAVLVLFWMVVLRPAIQIQVAPSIQVMWAGAIPAGDTVLGVLLLRLLLLAPPRPAARFFRLTAASVFLLLGGDLAAAYLAIQGSLRPGTLIEASWLLAALLLAFASERTLASPPPRPSGPGARLRLRFEPLLSVVFTYAIVGYTVLDWRFSGRLDWGGVGVAAFLTLLLFARQGAIVGQSEMRQFAAVVNASTDLSFICEADGRLRLANPALRTAIGARGPDEPAHLGDFLAADVPTGRLLQISQSDGWEGEVSFRRRDGASFPVSLSLIPVSDERRAQPILVGTAHDLTTVKEREIDLRAALSQLASAQRALEALNRELEDKVEDRTRELEDTVANLERLNEELKALDRLKSEFVTLVSHELRAPLTNIRSGVELVLAGDPDEKLAVAETLRLVMAETERLGRFVEAILDLSALEAGRFPIRLEPLEVEEAVRMACARFPESGEGRLSYRIPGGLPKVMADERALTSVLFHLLDNARKYAPAGMITVEAEAADNVFVSVADAGPGIPPEERERVFEIFHRLDSSDAREVYGHGLGLHLARQLLLAMNGGIKADEAPGGGARLTFWLPRAAGGGEESPRRTRRPAEEAGRHRAKARQGGS
jgi:signal transduction histidine kinase